MKKSHKIWIICLWMPLFGMAQNDSIAPEPENPSPIQLNGYLKDLRTLIIDGKGNSSMLSFLHNRLKLSYQLNESFTFKAEMRNRLFYGPGFEFHSLSDQLNTDAGWMDLSFVPLEDKSLVMSSQIDRLNVNYTRKNLDITIGRQRINWGINLVWNTNDLFNTLNFTDFDYEERPGSDAIRVQYYQGMNGLEGAMSLHKNLDSSVIGAMYKYNLKGYDLQAIASYFRGEAALGGGWAGSLKNVGFKGEFTWFSGNKSTPQLWMASPTLDYTFNNGLFSAVSFLFRSSSFSTNSILLNTSPASGNLDVKSLMPNKYSGFIQTSGAFSPILTGSLAAIYAIDLNAVFMMPSLAWAFKENMEFLLLGQSYFIFESKSVQSPFHAIFVRYKWNF